MESKRLLKLARHLRRGQLAHDEFDFSTFHHSNDLLGRSRGCGLGECPNLFPRVWGTSWSGTASRASRFFNISVEEARGLFFPRTWNDDDEYGLAPWRPGGWRLPGSCSKEDLADSIERFVGWKKGVLKITEVE